MHDTFAARNELEQKLMEAREGRLGGDDFMDYLMEMVQQLRSH